MISQTCIRPTRSTNGNVVLSNIRRKNRAPGLYRSRSSQSSSRSRSSFCSCSCTCSSRRCPCILFYSVHQLLDLRTREWATQIRKGPTRFEQLRRIVVDVVQQKDAFVESREQLLHRSLVKLLSGPGRDAFETFEHSCFVAFRLQATDKPSACICESFVIEIDRILSCQHHAQTKRASLFQEG